MLNWLIAGSKSKNRSSNSCCLGTSVHRLDCFKLVQLGFICSIFSSFWFCVLYSSEAKPLLKSLSFVFILLFIVFDFPIFILISFVSTSKDSSIEDSIILTSSLI